jgi:Gnt-I system low-affinity gluconate transporter
MEILIVGTGIAVLLVLILRLRLPAFMALLIVSAGVGLALGMPPSSLLASITSGMGNTLGFIAVVVGLGTMLGALLEFSGGVRAIAGSLLARGGEARAGWALAGTGLLVGVAVFFDVAFVILVPLIRPLCASSGRHPMYFATPLMAGLIVGHAFIPPTPGPIAVAELLEADLGWVIVMGLACGIPAAIVAGPVLANRYRSLPPLAPTALSAAEEQSARDSDAEQQISIRLGEALFAILLPLALIVGNTVGQRVLPEGALRTTLEFVGHPFIALLLACLYAYIAFGVSRRVPVKRLQEIMTRSLEPAGVVVLVTGAGGVFKQVLVDSGVGDLLGSYFSQQAIPPILLAFALSSLIRIAQGSATVAMITAAGLTAPLLQHLMLSPAQTALVVIAIAAGASVVSHVNDSGFWLVNRFLNQTEAETLKSWTVISTVAGVTGFLMASLIAAIL